MTLLPLSIQGLADYLPTVRLSAPWDPYRKATSFVDKNPMLKRLASKDGGSLYYIYYVQ
jgi:hypothetical protein